MPKSVPASEFSSELICRITGPGEGSWFLARPVVNSEAGADFRVDAAAPGELVLIQPRPGQPPWADLLEILEPSAARRTPPCSHAGDCGGCHWLHIDEHAQSGLRLDRLRQLLAAAGVSLPPGGIEHQPSPNALGYRVRARIQVEAGSKTRTQQIGFHHLGSRTVVDIPTCPLFSPELTRAYQGLRTALSHTPIEDLTGIELTAIPGAPGALCLLNPRDRPPASWPDCGARLLESADPAILSICVQPSRGDSRPAVLGPSSLLGHSPGGDPVAVSVRSFVQANLGGAELLSKIVVALARSAPGVRILELYAGSGLLSHALAAAGADVRSVENNPLAVEAARLLPASPAGRLAFETGDAGKHFAEHARGIDVLVVDPPRTGLGSLAEKLASTGPHRIVIVSCSVASLARDLAVLCRSEMAQPAYRLSRIVALELFPQTRHLETIVLLESSCANHL